VAQNIICQNDNTVKQKMLDTAFSYAAKGNENGLASLEKFCNAGKQDVDNNLKYGQANGINGTPMIIFPGGVVISGALRADMLNKLIDVLK
jgi:thiol:disulfide interchange protein DsbC